MKPPIEVAPTRADTGTFGATAIARLMAAVGIGVSPGRDDCCLLCSLLKAKSLPALGNTRKLPPTLGHLLFLVQKGPTVIATLCHMLGDSVLLDQQFTP